MVGPVYAPFEGELQLNRLGELNYMARCRWPSGSTFEWRYQHGQKYGPGRYTWTNGSVEVAIYEEDEKKGHTVWLHTCS